MDELGFHWTGFREILYLSIFLKYVGKFQVWLKCDNNNGYFTWKLDKFMICRWILFRMRNASDKVVDEIKKQVLCSVNYFRKLGRLWDNVEKEGKARQAIVDNIIRPRKDALCMPDYWGKNRHTLIIVSIYCFFTATMVTGTRLSVTLYVHCLSCWNMIAQYPTVRRRTSETRGRYWTRRGDAGQSFLTCISVRLLLCSATKVKGFCRTERKWMWEILYSVMIVSHTSRKCCVNCSCNFSKSIQIYLIPADTEIREAFLLS
jgi:hypothetical protein